MSLVQKSPLRESGSASIIAPVHVHELTSLRAQYAVLICGVVLIASALSLSACGNGRTATSPVVSADTKTPDAESEETLLKNLSDQQAALPKNSPKLEAPLEKLASYYELENRFDLAEKYLEQIVACHEASWNWERLSTSLEEQKKFDQAIEAMKKAVAIIEGKKNAENTAAVYIRYAKLLEKAGRQSEAAPLREKAHTLAPNVKNSTLRWHKKIPTN